MGAELKTARKPKIRERAGEEKEKAEKSFKKLVLGRPRR